MLSLTEEEFYNIDIAHKTGIKNLLKNDKYIPEVKELFLLLAKTYSEKHAEEKVIQDFFEDFRKWFLKGRGERFLVPLFFNEKYKAAIIPCDNEIRKATFSYSDESVIVFISKGLNLNSLEQTAELFTPSYQEIFDELTKN